MLKPILASLLVLVCSSVGAQNISTFAGSNENSFFNGGPGTNAQLFSPNGIFITRSGNLYIADANNNAVRMLNTGSDMITTVAGNGVMGHSSGAATAGELNTPWGVAVDDSGNIYIADGYGNRVRKVNMFGSISDIAGTGAAGYTGSTGPATGTELNYPYGVAVDSIGNVYIADQHNQIVRRIDTAGNIITIAGDTTAGYNGNSHPATATELNNPTGVTIGRGGYIYIADMLNNCIRVVSPGGSISTVAGNDTAGFTGDGMPATSARLWNPIAVTLDDSNNLYIADMNNNRIRMVDHFGRISTVAGGGSGGSAGFSGDGGAATNAQLSHPDGVAVDNMGNIYIADNGNNRIRRVDGSTGVITTIVGNNGHAGDGAPATSAVLQNPMGLCIDLAGNVYIADSGNHTVRKVNNSRVINVFAGTGSQGYTGDLGAAAAATLIQPVSVAANKSGDLFIADMGAQVIRKVSHSTFEITTVAGLGSPGYSGDGGAATAAELNHPYGIAVDSNDNLYIADSWNNVIRKVDATTNIISLYAGSASGSGYIGDNGPATAARLNSPAYIAIDDNNNLYIADTRNNVIRKVDGANGIITTAFGDGTSGSAGDGGTATAAQLASPVGVAVDNTGGIYAAVSGKIRHVPGGGCICPVNIVAGTGDVGMSPDGTADTAANFNGIASLLVDGTQLLISDAQNRVVRSVNTPAISGIGNTSKQSTLFSIIPNPNSGIFELTGTVTDQDQKAGVTYSVIDILGNVIEKGILTCSNNTGSAHISLKNNLPAGIYVCRISTSTGNLAIPFLMAK